VIWFWGFGFHRHGRGEGTTLVLSPIVALVVTAVGRFTATPVFSLFARWLGFQPERSSHRQLFLQKTPQKHCANGPSRL